MNMSAHPGAGKKRGTDSGLTVYTLCLKCSLEIMKFFTQLNFGRIILNQGRSTN